MRKKFEFWHSIVGLLAILGVEDIGLNIVPPDIMTWLLLAGSVVGSVVTLYVATEVIEEVKSARHMLVLLCAVVAEFVLFFMVEYWYLWFLAPTGFPMMPVDTSGLLLQSIMVLVFNPLYLPATFMGRALLIINTAGALGLMLFILQNVWQFRNAKQTK